MYPNPAFDLIQVISQKPLLGVPFEVLSYTGQLISNGNLDESLMLNIRSIPSGIYLLRLYIDEQAKIIRFIKANE